MSFLAALIISLAQEFLVSDAIAVCCSLSIITEKTWPH